MKIGMELLDHAVNPTQISEVRLKNMLKEWRALRQEQRRQEEALTEYYNTVHDVPRKARTATYAEFLKQRAELVQGQLNDVSVKRIVAHTPPDSLADGVNVDHVYTKYPM
jgi:hypothetical protein